MKFSSITLLAVASLLTGSNAEVQARSLAQADNISENVVSNLSFAQAVKKSTGERNLQNATNPVTKAEVRSWFSLWDQALATGDSRIVAEMYDVDGTLLPTLSDRVRTDFDGIKDYFDSFLAKEPRGEILEGYIEIGDDWASDIGVYEFTFGTTGATVRGRYSYFYKPQGDGTWKILHHHSSQMPEDMNPEPITKSEVQDLFSLWNDALKTGDPKAVARRYSKQGVLLPTMKDDSRTDFAGIEDYFISFLKDEPTGEILESNVMIGHNWAQDVGIYEFTFAKTGQKVRGRYSYVYIFEDGEWMISHHHSSVMPESIINPQPITEDEVRGLFEVWNDALKTLDPPTVAALYSEDGNLLPTLSDQQRYNRLEIADYFVKFLSYEPTGKIISGDIRIGTNWAQDAGIYEFTMGTTGEVVRGRYTFVYVYENGKWMISQHHSSMMPEASSSQSITKFEVRNLFKLWNAALLTKDPDAVARRYAAGATLLPTVSDLPRDTYDLIKDYFVKFLKGHPSGEILESFVHIGDNWASDVGIYEFTMATDGSKVRGRYSFVYVYEGGEWKISHHHSSQMPEEMTRIGADPADLDSDSEDGGSNILGGGIAVLGAAIAILGVALFGIFGVFYVMNNKKQSEPKFIVAAGSGTVAGTGNTSFDYAGAEQPVQQTKPFIAPPQPRAYGGYEETRQAPIQPTEVAEPNQAKSLIAGVGEQEQETV